MEVLELLAADSGFCRRRFGSNHLARWMQRGSELRGRFWLCGAGSGSGLWWWRFGSGLQLATVVFRFFRSVTDFAAADHRSVTDFVVAADPSSRRRTSPQVLGTFGSGPPAA